MLIVFRSVKEFPHQANLKLCLGDITQNLRARATEYVRIVVSGVLSSRTILVSYYLGYNSVDAMVQRSKPSFVIGMS